MANCPIDNRICNHPIKRLCNSDGSYLSIIPPWETPVFKCGKYDENNKPYYTGQVVWSKCGYTDEICQYDSNHKWIKEFHEADK